MATITIEVPDDIAERYQRASDEEKRQLQKIIITLLDPATARQQANRKLTEIMNQIGLQAQANGLTPEILERILNEE